MEGCELPPARLYLSSSLKNPWISVRVDIHDHIDKANLQPWAFFMSSRRMRGKYAEDDQHH